MKKGDLVLVKVYVTTGYAREKDEIVYSPSGNGLIKSLIRWRCPNSFKGIITGYSFRSTGHYYSGNSGSGYLHDTLEYDPPILREDKRHKVWMIQPFGSSDNRWYEPYACLEEDLELINDP